MGANIKQKSKQTGVNPHGLTAKGAKHVLSQSYLGIPCNVHKPFAICSYWNLNRTKVYLWWWWERSDDERYIQGGGVAGRGPSVCFTRSKPTSGLRARARNPLKSRPHYLTLAPQKQTPHSTFRLKRQNHQQFCRRLLNKIAKPWRWVNSGILNKNTL